MPAPDDFREPDISSGRRSPMSLLSDLAKHGSNLLRQEARLARAEMSENMGRLKVAIGEILAGTILVMVSLGILLSALVSGVARLLVALFAEDGTAAPDLIGLDGLDAAQVQIVTAVTRNVDAALDAARTVPTYEGLAALIVGVLFAVIGGFLLRNGINALDAGLLVPERTVRQVEKDGELVRNQTR